MRVYCAELKLKDEIIKAVYFTSEAAARQICEDWLDELNMRATDGDPEAYLYKVGVMDYTHKADDILEYWQTFGSVEDYYEEVAA